MRSIAAILPRNPKELQDRAKIEVVAQGGKGSDLQAVSRMVGLLEVGMSLGLPPAIAASELHWVRRKIVLSAQLQRQRLFQSGLCAKWEWDVDREKQFGVLKAERKDNALTWEIKVRLSDFAHLAKDAASAWSRYPYRMLYARASSWMIRDLFADVLAGVSTHEEAQEIAPDAKIPEEPEDDNGKTSAEENSWIDQAEAEAARAEEEAGDNDKGE